MQDFTVNVQFCCTATFTWLKNKYSSTAMNCVKPILISLSSNLDVVLAPCLVDIAALVFVC